MGSRKIYENTSSYDPGRLRYIISFYEKTITVDPDGGQNIVETLSLTTHCAMVAIEIRPSTVYAQAIVEAGVELLQRDLYFVLRYRSDWRPLKTMRAVVNGVNYTIRGIIEQDQPVLYWRLVCTADTIGE